MLLAVLFVLGLGWGAQGMYVRERKDAHMLVEDFMLLANKMVATYIAKKSKPEIPFIYRIHDLPNPDKLADFALFARELGFNFRMDKPEQITESFNQLAIAAKERMWRSNYLNHWLSVLWQKRVYSTNNIGHYGLGFEYYTHFTSPIRRYSDVLVHQGLFKNLTEITREDKELLEQKAKTHLRPREKASEAERESTKYFQTLYISSFIGQELAGVISGIIEKVFL